MSLLKGSNIEQLVNAHIRGHIARVGGTVDQLVNYRHCQVQDINIPDGGFGKVLQSDGQMKLSGLNWPILKRTVKQEYKFLRHGARISRDRKTIVLDMHDAHKHPSLMQQYDCAISSNVLEHSPNPIMLLLNFYFVTKKTGFQFHALPHYAYTYDQYRIPTTLEHMIEDFEKNRDAGDLSHVEDYRQSAIEKHGWQRKFHEKYPLTYPFIHYHVFDEQNTYELFAYVFQNVTNDVYKTDRFSDNVVIASNALNPAFAEKYQHVLRQLEKNYGEK